MINNLLGLIISCFFILVCVVAAPFMVWFGYHYNAAGYAMLLPVGIGMHLMLLAAEKCAANLWYKR